MKYRFRAAKSFHRALAKLPLAQKKSAREAFRIFRQDPFDPRLRTHKLSGRLSELWSFSTAYDLRVIFCFQPQNRAMFENIGTHDEVY